MDDRDAFARGAAGERRVAKILNDLRPSLGYSCIDDILLDFNGKTSQIDHVLIDQYGVLVIETKTYGALLRGTSEDRFWTACYSDQRRRQMFNPLLQNDAHRKWLRKLLCQNGRELPENYVQSLIVFAHGEIGALELSGVDPLRVISPKNLEEFVRARYDFQPNEGQLGHEAQLDLYNFISSANQTGNPEVEKRHIASVQKAQGRKTTPKNAPALRTRASKIPSRPHRRNMNKKDRDQLARLGFALALFFLLTTCGRSCSPAPFLTAVGQQPAAPQQKALPFDTGQALGKVRESQPSLVTQFSNPASPQLSSTNGLPTYTWSYGGRGGASSHTYSITLDANGNIVRVAGR